MIWLLCQNCVCRTQYVCCSCMMFMIFRRSPPQYVVCKCILCMLCWCVCCLVCSFNGVCRNNAICIADVFYQYYLYVLFVVFISFAVVNYVYIYIYTHIYLSVCMSIYIYIEREICIHIYIYIPIYLYIHIYIHMCLPPRSAGGPRRSSCSTARGPSPKVYMYEVL